MNIDELKLVAAAIVAKQKGLLAADESNPTIKKRFDAIQLESTEENRRRYRELLFTAGGIERYISGVILFDETLRQSSAGGIPFVRLLSERGIIPGIKVDKGAKSLALYSGNQITEGLDGLQDRLAEYRQLGARFAKWRAVIQIDECELPAPYAVHANVHALARYAALCQEADIVPIVEPEVLMDGKHGIERCEAVTSQVLKSLFEELDAHRIAFEGILLKPNMVIAGLKCPSQPEPRQIAEATVRCLKRYVPAAIPGIVFLSGGQSPQDATANLSAINELGPQPWQLSFSYGRALQAPVLDAWKGRDDSKVKAQEVFFKRCRLNGLARDGTYTESMEGN